MARDTQRRRAELRERLVDIAESQVRAEGSASLRARALAEDAGCAVGAIYNVFTDMPGLQLAVNGRTFARLGLRVTEAVAQHADAPPVERLILMAKAYLAFASDDPNLWRALFEVEMTAESDVPEWYLKDLNALFAIIAAPLAEIDPHTSPDEIDLRTRALFSSVHGIILLGLERRISGVPMSRMEAMIEYVLRSFADRASWSPPERRREPEGSPS
ncbi:MAG: TetR/AcrR family transcriptional regulator [Pseudomonadota bacterium]